MTTHPAGSRNERDDGSARAVIFVAGSEVEVCPPPSADVVAYRRAKQAHESASIPNPRIRAVISAEEAFKLLGIDRTTGYRAIRDGTFPLPVVRVGRLIRVPTVAVLRLLQLDGAVSPSTETRQPEEPGAA
jgi:excisionase family DNA binding protein